MNQVPEIAQKSIKQMIRKDQVQELNTYVRQMVLCWDLWEFESKVDAQIAYATFVTANQIRTWCRRNKITTRKGTFHCIDGREEEFRPLWEIVTFEGNCDGVKWSRRKVDEIRNIYIGFD